MSHSLIKIDDYEPLVGAEIVDRIHNKAKPLYGSHIVNVNSTYQGGGVATLLDSLTLLMKSVDIHADWRVIQGATDFFSITKKMHNSLQGGEMHLTDRKKQTYEEIVYKNAMRNYLDDHDFVIIHDPQPLPIINHYKKTCPWIWRCHIDISNPYRPLWNYLLRFVEQYDVVILSIKEYQQKLKTPQRFFLPAIDPFTNINKDLSEAEIDERLERHNIPTDLPIVAQISRYDKWKDPEGVIKAFQIARKEIDCRLVLLGNTATDDPEGEALYQSLLSHQNEDILLVKADDSVLVNALQRRATVVLQKSIREGFGLTVSEAMWKGTPVIGGNVGGIKYQIDDGENGFLVSSIEEAAQRIVKLLQDKRLCEKIGQKAKEKVRKHFLLSHYLEQYLDLFNSFEAIYKLKDE